MINKIYFVLLLLIFYGSVYAQGFSASGLAMAYNNIASSKNNDAFRVNPANLAYNNNGMGFSFISLNTEVSNSAFSIHDYNRFFTEEGHHGHLSEEDEKDLLDLISDDGLQVNTQVGFNVFSFVYNNWGFGADVIANGGVNIKSKKALETLFELDFTEDYEFSEPNFASGSSFSALKFSFAYAHLLKTDFPQLDISDIAVAVKLNYFAGISVIDVLDSDISAVRSNSSPLTIDNEVVEYNVRVRVRTALPENRFSVGSGFGFDLGASAKYDKKWQFTVLFENLFASINWNANTEITEFQSFDSSYVYSDDKVDRSLEVDTTMATGSFRTPLPANLYLAASYQMMENLLLTAQWKQGLSRDFENVLIPQVGVGAEYYVLDWLPIRSGITVGGKNDFIFGLGAGLDFAGFDFNISYAMQEALWPTKSNGVYFAYDLTFGF